MLNRIDNFNDICTIKYEWFLNYRRHCSTGPAIEYVDGQKEWWLNGTKVTETDVKCLSEINYGE